MSASLKHGLIGAWCPSVSRSRSVLLPDESGWGKHGTLTNMDAATDWVGIQGGVCLDFDGSDDTVVLPSVAITSNQITVSLWMFRPSLTNRFEGVFGIRVDDGDDCEILLGSANTVFFGNWGSVTESAIAPVAGLWHHILVTANDTKWNGYINGVLAATSVNTIGFTTFTTAPTIAPTRVNKYTGRLDDVRIYNRPMPAGEVLRMYQLGRGYGLRPTTRRTRYAAAASTAKPWHYYQQMMAG